MFRFESPIFLYLLLLVPVLVVIRLLYQRNKMRKLKRFGDPQLLNDMMQGVSKYRPAVKFWLIIAALIILILMLAALMKEYLRPGSSRIWSISSLTTRWDS